MKIHIAENNDADIVSNIAAQWSTEYDNIVFVVRDSEGHSLFLDDFLDESLEDHHQVIASFFGGERCII